MHNRLLNLLTIHSKPYLSLLKAKELPSTTACIIFNLSKQQGLT